MFRKPWQTITQQQALKRGMYWNVGAAVISIALLFTSSWVMVVGTVAVLVLFHLAGYWYGYARAMRVGGHREMFAQGDGVIIQVVGAQLTPEAKGRILEALEAGFGGDDRV